MILGGTLIEPGDVREVHLPVTEAANSRPVLLPITIIRGPKEGPTLFLTAAVHGDELNGTAILRELLERIKPAKLSGTLIIIPIVNIMSFVTQSRYLPDRRDLNRVFPGRARGNMAQRFAFRLFEEVIRLSDFGIDLHTAAEGRENFPHIRGDLSNAKVRELARAFSPYVILDDIGRPGTLRRAATERGIPSIVFEGGTANKFERSIVQGGVAGIERLLVKMGMLRKKLKKKKRGFQVIVRKAQWIRAERGGILELKTAPGGLVYRGEPIAEISNPFGRDVHVVPSPITGIVIGVTTSPVATPGTPIIHVVELQKTLATVERAIASGAFKAPKL